MALSDLDQFNSLDLSYVIAGLIANGRVDSFGARTAETPRHLTLPAELHQPDWSPEGNYKCVKAQTKKRVVPSPAVMETTVQGKE